jgi:endonuclease/exonuclease/phosphatase family metal-dependent hydrolase
MKTIGKILRWLGLVILAVVLAALGFLWFGNYHPAPVESEAVACPADAPVLESGQSIKILTWNVQTMLGKNYVFWSDLPDSDGPDDKASQEDITLTFEETVRIIHEENPDIVMIQEIDNGAERTYYEDQLARLVSMLPEYPCVTSTFSWKSAYVPHPRIKGSVGWEDAILSKYKIIDAERIALSFAKSDFVTDQFKIKPALLKVTMPILDGSEFAALTVHLDLYVPGTDAKDIQLREIDAVLVELNAAGTPWVLGGDFNLLPPDDASFSRLHPDHQKYYNTQSEIKYLFDRYQSVPSLEQAIGTDFAAWLTRWPNDPVIPAPDRTLDYFFFPDSLILGEHYVRFDDTLHISDHMPIIVEVTLP